MSPKDCLMNQAIIIFTSLHTQYKIEYWHFNFQEYPNIKLLSQQQSAFFTDIHTQ